MAATDPDSGCGRTAGGSGAAQQLQQEAGQQLETAKCNSLDL